MNTYIIGLILYGIILISLSAWGLGLLDDTCEDNNLRYQIRMILLCSSVMITSLICYMLCKTACFPAKDENIHYIIPTIVTVTGIMSITSFSTILKNINDCSSKNVDTYKTFALYLGVIPSVVMTIGGSFVLGKRFYKWYKVYSDKSSEYKKKKKEAKEAKEQKQRVQKQAKKIADANERLLEMNIKKKREEIDAASDLLDSEVNPEKIVSLGRKRERLEKELINLESGGSSGSSPIGRGFNPWED